MGIDSIIKIAYKILYKPYHRLLDIPATRNIKKHIQSIQNKEKVMPIKVGFIVQMPELWDKRQPVYERMAIDHRFEISLIVVPQYDFEHSILGEYGKEKEYFANLYPNATIIWAATDNGDIVDLQSYHFDYIFYERSYEHYLPEKLRCSYVSRFTKTCYIPYATPDFAEGGVVSYKEYYRYVYIGFLNSEIRKKTLIDSFTKHAMKYHRFECLGYPILDECRNLPLNPHEKTTIMWTPRWAFTADLGESHFLDYKDNIVEYAKVHPEVRVIQRPHPLMFSNILKNNIMTSDEVDTYKKMCVDHQIEFDSNMLIEETYKETDILVSDLSSVLWLFFYTGRPIIYCPSDIEISEDIAELIDLMYVAKDWVEVSSILDELLKGNDPMKADREAYLAKQKEKYKDIAQNMVEYIYDDYIA